MATMEERVAALEAWRKAITPVGPTTTPVGTVVTDPAGVLRYANGVEFRITGDRKINRLTPPATVPVVDAITSGVVAICNLTATTVGQRNTAGNYYTSPITGPLGAWTQIAATAAAAGSLYVAPPPVAAGSVFKVQNGQIYKPDGSTFKPTGVDIWWTCISNKDGGRNEAQYVINDWNTGYPLLRDFPNLNAIRMACFRDGAGLGGFPTVAELKPWVDFFTSKKIVLIIDPHDYSGGSNWVYSYADGTLQQAIKFLQDHATAWKNNPYVWFQTENEPGTPNDDEMNALYDAVRNAGNNSIVALSWVTYGHLDRVTRALPTRMKNIIIDVHYYAIAVGSGNKNLQEHINYIARQVIDLNNTFKSADGEIPICCLEFGDACCGSVEAGGLVAVEAVAKSAFKGWTLWNYCTPWNGSWGHDVINDRNGAVLGGAILKPLMIKG